MRRKRYFILILTAIFLTFSVSAFDVVEPTAQFYVADYSNVIDSETENYIVSQNDALYASTGAQICVVTVDFIGTAEIEDYAYKLFNDWGIGSSDENNGILLLLVIGAEDYYAVQGSGLERYLSSGDLGDILYEYLEPDFAEANYDDGVRKVFDALYDKTSSVYGGVQDQYSQTIDANYEEEVVFDEPLRRIGHVFNMITLIVIIVLIIVISSIGRSVRSRHRWGAPPRGHWGGHVRRTPPPPPPPPPGGFNRPGGFGRPSGFGGVRRDSGFNRPKSGGGSSFGGGASRSSGGRSGGHSGPRSGGGGASRGGGAGRRR